MNDIDSLLALVGIYCEATKLAEATVSTRIMHDGKRIAAMRAGRDIGVRRCREAIQWLSENWPAEAEWPVGIDRPSPPTSPSDSDTAHDVVGLDGGAAS